MNMYMYVAEDDKIYVIQDEKKELFLTVHPTDTGATLTVEQQARILVRVLCSLGYNMGDNE
jgi:hypothetical protein